MSAFKYMPLNPYHIFLRMMEPEIVFFALTRSLKPIGKAIQESAKAIDRAAASSNEQYSEIITDEECEIIENLLGTAFVICQTHITTVVSRVKEIHSFFQAREGRPLGGFDKSKPAILKRGSNIVSGSPFTYVEAIDAFANYFKHRDEWPGNWSRLPTRHARTREIITAFGVQPHSTGNLRAGAKALGNAEYHSVIRYADNLEVWRMNLRNAYAEELKVERVI